MMRDHMWGIWGMGPGMMLLFAVVLVVPAWRICARAGYPGALGLLAVVPIVNIGLLYFIAFAQWPIEQRRTKASGSADTS